VLIENATNVTGYFPDDGNGWYDPSGVLRPVPSGKQALQNNETVVVLSAFFCLLGGGNVTIDAPIEVIPWSIRGGNIIPTQTPETTTAATRKNPYQLIGREV